MSDTTNALTDQGASSAADEQLQQTTTEPTEGVQQEQAAEGDGQTPPEGEQPQPEPERKQNGIQKRIAELVQERNAERARVAAAEAELARLRAAQPKPEERDPNQPLTQADIDRMVQERARQIAAEQAQQQAAAAQAKATSDWFSAGEKANPEFRSQCVTLGHMAPTDEAANTYLQVAMGLENGHAATAALAADPDEAARVLALPPHQMAIEVFKLANKAPAPKPVSQAPAPIRAVNGTARSERDIYDPDIPYSEYVKKIGLVKS